VTAQQRADRAVLLVEVMFAVVFGVVALALAWARGASTSGAWLFAVGTGCGFRIAGERHRMNRVRAGARRDLLRDLDPGSVSLTHERGCEALPCTCSPTVHLIPPHERPRAGTSS
jgi:hypothetical protein